MITSLMEKLDLLSLKNRINAENRTYLNQSSEIKEFLKIARRSIISD